MAFEVPALPYDYTALDSVIDEKTMHLHHDMHHAAYVKNLNAALEKYPMNAWLLTSKASALYEMKRYDEAVPVATQAVASTQALTLAQWRSSYPGNNPETSQRGIATIRKAAADNLKKILAARDGKK